MNSTELIGRARDRWNEIDHEDLDWFSFFNGWLEGRADIVYPKKQAGDYGCTLAATLAGDYSTETGDYSTETGDYSKTEENGDK